ncbi:hypothetical protein [Paracoccus aminophilus]|uniref:Uncharacterized protein n=1 Tax=Paracoccus aminophilus JCM 7686 TaxID=1367847 RepID=S5YQF9_PARAH|nr:hypothetical protein [Paracoccus aminophilus]AGT07501.1 hypothetical protein JCM7686_0392 [Paracoccus aminophilus JCM 7686]
MKLRTTLTVALTLTALTSAMPVFAETVAPKAVTAQTATAEAATTVQKTVKSAAQTSAQTTAKTAARQAVKPVQHHAATAKQAPHPRAHVGDVLKTADYTAIKDPSVYKLKTQAGWTYYRGNDQRIYRTDVKSGKVLAVLTPVKAPAKGESHKVAAKTTTHAKAAPQKAKLPVAPTKAATAPVVAD